CYEQLKQSAQALADYSKALELNAKDAGCLEERGNLYLKTGDYKNAALDLNAAVKLAPRDPDKYRSRAVLHRLEKHYDLVVQDFDQSIRLNKSQPNPFDYIQRAQAKARLSQESAALADCDQAIKLMPLLDTSYLAKADILMKFKKTDQALKVINQCLTSELYRTPPAQGWSEAAGGPDYAFVLRKRAAILDSLGRSKEAAKDRQEATKVSKSAEIQPFNAKYLFTD
ncbi:MAG TPA: tetratricopeptide repeat protein, partial [Candidatus Obscuribacter sp.]|nr:tetratricopeptide repeat protein [Candidatus Obscuribacter sp.]